MKNNCGIIALGEVIGLGGRISAKTVSVLMNNNGYPAFIQRVTPEESKSLLNYGAFIRLHDGHYTAIKCSGDIDDAWNESFIAIGAGLVGQELSESRASVSFGEKGGKGGTSKSSSANTTTTEDNDVNVNTQVQDEIDLAENAIGGMSTANTLAEGSSLETLTAGVAAVSGENNSVTIEQIDGEVLANGFDFARNLNDDSLDFAGQIFDVAISVGGEVVDLASGMAKQSQETAQAALSTSLKAVEASDRSGGENLAIQAVENLKPVIITAVIGVSLIAVAFIYKGKK